MTQEALDALEEWHKTTRALRVAKPGTSEWVRLRMIAEEQRAAYEALLSGTESSAGPSAEVSGPPKVPEHQPK